MSGNAAGHTTNTFTIVSDGLFVMSDMFRSPGGGTQNLNLSGTWKILINDAVVYNKTDTSRGPVQNYGPQEFDVHAGDNVAVSLVANGDRGDNGSFYGSTTSCSVYFKLK